jgi:hypothetical protein
MIREELDFFSKCFASFKSNYISAFNSDFFASLRISAHSGFTIKIAKCTKADQSHPAVSFLQTFSETKE